MGKKTYTPSCSTEFRERAIQRFEDHRAEYASGNTSEEKAQIKELERENRELRQANEILKKASAYFAQAELDRPFRK